MSRRRRRSSQRQWSSWHARDRCQSAPRRGRLRARVASLAFRNRTSDPHTAHGSFMAMTLGGTTTVGSGGLKGGLVQASLLRLECHHRMCATHSISRGGGPAGRPARLGADEVRGRDSPSALLGIVSNSCPRGRFRRAALLLGSGHVGLCMHRGGPLGRRPRSAQATKDLRETTRLTRALALISLKRSILPLVWVDVVGCASA